MTYEFYIFMTNFMKEYFNSFDDIQFFRTYIFFKTRGI